MKYIIFILYNMEKYVMLFEEFTELESTNEANIDNVLSSPANIIGWIISPQISLVRYLIRTSQKKKMLTNKLAEIEDPIERKRIKDELMKLTKEELKDKLEFERQIKLREKSPKAENVSRAEIQIALKKELAKIKKED